MQLPQFAHLQSAHELAGLIESSFSLECEPPNNSIYTFEGVLTMKAADVSTTTKSASSTPKPSPRGSPGGVVRNKDRDKDKDKDRDIATVVPSSDT